MKNTQKLVPELRFPEFAEDGEWELKQVDEYFSVGSSKRVLQKDWTNSGVPFYRTRELVSLSKNDPFGSEIYISKNLYSRLKENYGVPTEGDFLVSGVGTLGINYQVKASDKFYFKDGNVLWFKLERELNSTYFKYCFESEHIQKQIDAQTSKSTVGTYTIQNAKKTEFWFPSTSHEQQKIAACLTSLDELIAAHNDKLETLKGHKKGLMQNLFPQDGETVPKYRFPEFEEDGEWVEKELGDLVTIKGRIGYRGYTKEDIVSKGEGAISMSPSNISAQGALSFEKSTYITWDKYYESPEIMLENGFTVLVKTGSTFGKVAFISNLVEKATINPQLVVLKPEDINNFFLYLIVSNTAVQTQITATVVGGAIPTLSQDSISKFEVMIPKEKEQQKIASCLSALDDLITAAAEKIEHLQLHTKG